MPEPATGGGGAERRLVSVLFADLVAFTQYSEGRDPELVRETLTRYFEATRDVIERHGGQVEKFIGDAVMAEWGAPRANEDDAERAVRAALEVINAVNDLGEGLHARVAVLTGQAAVTLGATDQGMVAGDLVNTAARLQGAAPPDTVLVGQATMQAASGAIVFEEVGEQTLKGKASPVPAWRAVRVVGDTGGRGRSEVLEPPFVGRDVELRLLKDLLHTTGEERRPRLISITGPGGIGKSRLAWEFEKYVDGVVERVYWHRGRAPSYGEGISFWALGEMVRRRAGLAENDDEATARERIHATVDEFVAAADAAWVEQALLALLGIEPPPPGGRDALFAAWRTFFERIAAKHTTVMLFEDLQWADAGQLDFIDHLLEWAKGVPLLVITLARPELLEVRPGWGTGARSFNAIGLEPLTDAHMRALLLGLVPRFPEAGIEQVLARADGIPLYAVETVRMLIAEGRLAAEADGTYRPSGDFGQLAIPDTLRALVASRLDGLDADDRALIQDATVLGQTFDPRALAHVNGGDEDVVETRLRLLVKRELLEISVDPRSPERGNYGFVQSVIREVAYDTLSRRDRRARHLAAARYFEAVGDDELAAVLATHYLAALQASDEGPEADGLQVQARLALRGAADRAMALGSPDQAMAHLRAALEITTDRADQAQLSVLAAHAAIAAFVLEEAAEFARDAVASFETAGDHRAALSATALIGSILLDSSRLDEAVAIVEQAEAEAEAYPEVHAELLATLARAYMRLSREPDSVAAADRAIGIAEPLRLDRIVAEAMANKGAAMMGLRRQREPELYLRAAAELAAQAGDVALELRVRMNLGAGLSTDDLPAAMRTWRETLELATRLGQRKNANWVTFIMSSSMGEEGLDWDGALAIIDDALQVTRDDTHRSVLLGSRIWYMTMRGQDTGDLWSELDQVQAGLEDVEEFMSVRYLPGYEHWFAGRYREALTAFREVMPLLGQSEGESRWGQVISAMALRDVDAMREAERLIRDHPQIGNVPDGTRAAAASFLAALEGRRDEAISFSREAARRFEDAGWHFVLAELKVCSLMALEDPPELADWVEEARARFELLGAAPWLRRLDQAIGSRPTGATVSRPTGATAPS